MTSLSSTGCRRSRARPSCLKTVPDDKKSVVTLQTGTKYTNDYWTQFGQDMVAFCQGEMEANDVLKNMDTNRAEAAKTVGDENWK